MNEVEIENSIQLRKRFIYCHFNSGSIIIASFYPSTAAALIRQASCNQPLKVVCTSQFCPIYLFKFIFNCAGLFFSLLKHFRWGPQTHRIGNITQNWFSNETNVFYIEGVLLVCWFVWYLSLQISHSDGTQLIQASSTLENILHFHCFRAC